MSLRTIAVAAFAALALSSILSSPAEARQLYWTGQGYATTSGECQANASYSGEAGARNSCINDYGIQPQICDAAPIVSVQNISLTPWGPNYTCEVRVYIYVP